MKVTLVLVCVLFCKEMNCRVNNVCKSLFEYHTRIINKNCWYDPELTADALELISNQGYTPRTYQVTTKDGYILSIFRIPSKSIPSKGVVYLQHPAEGSAAVWIDLKNDSLAFMLHEAGYDVWMGNFRGTVYSIGHVRLSPKKQPRQYWNFSWHEMGIYDLPAFMELVKSESKEKVYYIGHSMGTTTALLYSSLLAKHAKNHIKMLILWSPIAFLKHVTTVLRILAPFADLIMAIGQLTASVKGPSFNGPFHKLVKNFCFNINIYLCVFIIQIASGVDVKYFDPELFPMMVYQNFAGLSLKSTVHYLQLIKSNGRFQQYDYGLVLNKKYYHSRHPPKYPLENIEVPIHLVYGAQDACAVEKDVFHLYESLPNKSRMGVTKIPYYNHVDFHYGKNLVDFVYKPVLQFLQNSNFNFTEP